jgi:hypothetical protein
MDCERNQSVHSDQHAFETLYWTLQGEGAVFDARSSTTELVVVVVVVVVVESAFDSIAIVESVVEASCSVA